MFLPTDPHIYLMSIMLWCILFNDCETAALWSEKSFQPLFTVHKCSVSCRISHHKDKIQHLPLIDVPVFPAAGHTFLYCSWSKAKPHNRRWARSVQPIGFYVADRELIIKTFVKAYDFINPLLLYPLSTFNFASVLF